MATILPKKANQDNAIATDDDHHDALANDPTVNQFPQGSSFGSTTNATSATNSFSLPSNGASTFASTTTAGQSSTSGFGFSTPASSSPTTSSFGSSNSFAAAATPNTPTAVVTGFGGKPAPIQPPDPVI